MKKLTTLLFALMLTASMGFAQNNDADVNQNGNNNNAEVDQTGTMLNANIDIDGNNNRADIDQVSNGSDDLTATIRQLGNMNRAQINQGTDGLVLESTIRQLGNQNRASADLTGGGLSSSGASSFQLQDGNGNRADAVLTTGREGALIDQRQIGNDNVANGVGRTNAEIRQTQRGDRNRAVSDQISRRSESDQVQIGNDNRAIIELDGSNPEQSNIDVDLLQRQEGNRNYSLITDIGRFSTVTTRQFGNDNRALVENNFDDGAVLRNQDTTIDILQDGNDNFARVFSDETLGDNTATIRQLNNDNRARITFTTDNNDASIIQNGNGNNAVVNQN